MPMEEVREDCLNMAAVCTAAIATDFEHNLCVYANMMEHGKEVNLSK